MIPPRETCGVDCDQPRNPRTASRPMTSSFAKVLFLVAVTLVPLAARAQIDDPGMGEPTPSRPPTKTEPVKTEPPKTTTTPTTPPTKTEPVRVDPVITSTPPPSSAPSVTEDVKEEVTTSAGATLTPD